MAKTEPQPLVVMLIEDNPQDVVLTQAAIDRLDLPVVLTVARDGAEGLRILRQSGTGGASPLPEIVLLDTNLPLLSGREVLQEMKADATLSHIPIVVISGSDSEQDIMISYRLGAAGYVIKPGDFQTFSRALGWIVGYWLTVARPRLGTSPVPAEAVSLPRLAGVSTTKGAVPIADQGPMRAT